MSKEKVPYGKYSELDSCPKCGYKGVLSKPIVNGKPKWILDEIKINDNEYEYICAHCRFRWIEVKEFHSNSEKIELLKEINDLKDKYQKLMIKFNELSQRVEKLEKERDIEKIDIDIPDLDRTSFINSDEDHFNGVY